ncbi:MAG TPA: DUF3224 domain-containing protein [Ktedonobacterales bacterium]
MSERATGTIEMKSWEERPFAESPDTPKLTRANGSDLYHGDLEGEATFEYLMMYQGENAATYVGMERFVGQLGGRHGSFVLQLNGTYANGVVQATWSVVSGSGAGDLRGLRGDGELIWKGHQESSITFDYDFD